MHDLPKLLLIPFSALKASLVLPSMLCVCWCSCYAARWTTCHQTRCTKRSGASDAVAITEYGHGVQGMPMWRGQSSAFVRSQRSHSLSAVLSSSTTCWSCKRDRDRYTCFNQSNHACQHICISQLISGQAWAVNWARNMLRWDILRNPDA